MQYKRMPIEVESPEEMGYGTIQYNLAESSVRDLQLNELGIELSDLTLFYGHHKGNPDLMKILASEGNFSPDDILVCTGAATALFIVSTTLLGRNDHLVVIRPNYATNLETPRAIGCEVSVIDLEFENQFQVQIEQVLQSIKPNTRLISITTPHNPTGTIIPDSIVDALVALAEQHNCYLLVDETYRYLNFQTPRMPYAAEKSKRVISVSSLSKAFGVPGVRIGWIINRDAQLMHQFLAAKEQIIICNPVIDEQIALIILQAREARLARVHEQIRMNFTIIKKFFDANTVFEWVEPIAGVVCFPRLKASLEINMDEFYPRLYEQYKTVVGRGHWFERDQTYMRIGFGYPTSAELEQGLQNIKLCLRE